MARVNLSSLDLNLLVALDALLRHGTVTEAAQDLALSQPAMSRTLQRLREALGDPLFVRAGRGLVATPRARELAGPAREALDAAERVFGPPATFDPASARGAVSVALGDEAQVAFGDAITAGIWEEAPGLDVHIRGLTAATPDAARRGLIDLAVGPDLGALPPSAGAVDLSDFVARPLYERRFVVVSAAPWAPGALDLDAYCAAAHTLVSFDGSGRGFVDDVLAGMGRQRRVAATMTSFYAVAALVARSQLLATLPAEVAAASPFPLHVSEAPFALPRIPMLCLWHPHRTPDPRHRYVRERVMAVLRRRAPAAP